jgi:hypothetical protein
MDQPYSIASAPRIRKATPPRPKQRDELTSLQLVEVHLDRPPGSSNWQNIEPETISQGVLKSTTMARPCLLSGRVFFQIGARFVRYIDAL